MLEIISKEIDKSKGISLLINDLKIKKENVYVIGDSYTDINMIRDFNGYCMKHSINELKSISKKEYKSVRDLIIDIKNS